MLEEVKLQYNEDISICIFLIFDCQVLPLLKGMKNSFSYFLH